MTAKTIDEVIINLEAIIQKSKKEESALGYFAALYHNVTLTVKDRLNTNYFEDDERMEKLDVVFANRYLSAYSKFKEGKQVTDSWKYAFQSSENKSLIVLQHLLLGMNAHINLDLGIAAAEISDERTLENLQSDFNKINDILSSLIDEVQRDLAEIWPTLFRIIKFFKKVDDYIINFSMQITRDEAWMLSKSIVGKMELEKVDLINKRDRKVLELSKRLTNYGTLVKIFLIIIRIGERGKPSDKIKAFDRLGRGK